jgi:hypothetical protein
MGALNVRRWERRTLPYLVQYGINITNTSYANEGLVEGPGVVDPELQAVSLIYR